jgi:hypothetical protein
MRGRVTVALDPIARNGKDRAGGIGQHRADRHLASFGPGGGFVERARHRRRHRLP